MGVVDTGGITKSALAIAGWVGGRVRTLSDHDAVLPPGLVPGAAGAGGGGSFRISAEHEEQYHHVHVGVLCRHLQPLSARPHPRQPPSGFAKANGFLLKQSQGQGWGEHRDANVRAIRRHAVCVPVPTPRRTVSPPPEIQSDQRFNPLHCRARICLQAESRTSY